MKVEIVIQKMIHKSPLEKILADNYCLFNSSNKRPTRDRIKKLLARNGLMSRVSYINKDKNGHYHLIKSGKINECTDHFCWYYIEVIPIKEEVCTTKVYVVN